MTRRGSLPSSMPIKPNLNHSTFHHTSAVGHGELGRVRHKKARPGIPLPSLCCLSRLYTHLTCALTCSEPETNTFLTRHRNSPLPSLGKSLLAENLPKVKISTRTRFHSP